MTSIPRPQHGSPIERRNIPTVVSTPIERRKSHKPAAMNLENEWRFFLAAVLMTALVPMMIHMRISSNDVSASPTFLSPRPRKLDIGMGTEKAHQKLHPRRNQHKNKQSSPRVIRNKDSLSLLKQDLIQAANDAEQETLNFFHGERRSLQDGVPFGGADDASTLLAERLANRIWKCHHLRKLSPDSNSNRSTKKDCVLRVVFLGSAQTTGRDNFFNATFPFQSKARLRSVAEAAGLDLQVWNHAMDSDLHREGPQSTHMCVSNFMGPDPVDVVVWDLDGILQANPKAQVEAFVRWTLLSQAQPALILFNKGGPHGRSRRGKQRAVVNLGPGHDAFVYEDDPNNDMPEPRPDEDVYQKSKEFQQRWQKGRNSFWETIFQKYAKFVDFSTVDPHGSIWHLDHLLEFSNQAFDAGKVLPLVDCGPAHDPPCNQIPDFVQRHLARANLTEANIPRNDAGGAVCSSMLGCRHVWYGGKRSHELRGELNALPILRALRQAANKLQPEMDSATRDNDNTAKSIPLPPPEYCSKKFCSLKPNCITSYIPNLGPDLASAILSNETSPASMPQKGASHFLNDPQKQISNLDVRFGPLGYRDRKFGYHLKQAKKKNRKDTSEPEGASTTGIGFTSSGPGPLVLCEPPCFIDSCSKRRRMPLLEYVTLELDGTKLDTAKKLPWAVEVGGPFCKVIAASVAKGSHILRISTAVEDPDHVMFSHLIPFS
ncbi:expressed unknown protein [Seminavis robusta]|uniref:Uncharacterized protein n=1 Tax=Seminavis robusta TaxID=568900 RepID=A0A9N8E638_9STRA|nr:expressed unknown protein [Seminavis robusta]|eukprot:Sro537_g162320.1 n/a (715) ;mRNA; f:20465-22700